MKSVLVKVSLILVIECGLIMAQFSTDVLYKEVIYLIVWKFSKWHRKCWKGYALNFRKRSKEPSSSFQTLFLIMHEVFWMQLHFHNWSNCKHVALNVSFQPLFNSFFHSLPFNPQKPQMTIFILLCHHRVEAINYEWKKFFCIKNLYFLKFQNFQIKFVKFIWSSK